MPELPRDFSYELIEEARGVIMNKVAAYSPIHEDDLVNHVSAELFVYRDIAYYALSTFDELKDDNGLISFKETVKAGDRT